MQEAIKKALVGAMTYLEYRAMMDALLEDGKTTGPIQTDAYVHYTMMNQARMRRLDKTIKVSTKSIQEITAISSPQTWLIITEAWCGDAAQIIPVLKKIADLNDSIQTRFVLRDEHEELMDLFLTNGGRSIPKVIVIDNEKEEVLFDWGPRPHEVQDMVNQRKLEKDSEPYMEFAEKVQKWYAKDKTKSTQEEFITALMA